MRSQSLRTMAHSLKFWMLIAELWFLIAHLISGETTVWSAETTDLAAASYRVWNASADGQGMSGGSGTAIGPHAVVTNSHVVDHRIGHQATLYSGRGGKCEGQVIAANPAIDVAIIVTEAELDWVKIAGTEPQVHESITFMGWMGGAGALTPRTGQVLAHGNFKMSPAGTPIVELSTQSVQGDSGGGVFNRSGELVAIVWGSDGQRAMATSAQRLSEWLPAVETQWGRVCGPEGCRPVYRGPQSPAYSQPRQPIYQPPPQTRPTPQPTPQAPPVDMQPVMARLEALDKKLGSLESRVGTLEKIADQASSALTKLGTVKAPPGPPGPPGKDGRDGKDGKDGKSCDRAAVVAAVVEQLKANPPSVPATNPSTSCPPDSSAQPPIGVPSVPSGDPSPTHFVLVADLESYDYRKLESTWLVPARKALPGHVVGAKQLPFNLVPLPQVVVYDAQQTPISIAKGGFEVEQLLKQVAQGK